MHNHGEATEAKVNHGEAIEAKVVSEEYKVWKKNSPFLYDLVMTHALEWPSLTVQWFPSSDGSSKRVGDDNRFIFKLILGTHTSNDEQNYLMVASSTLPATAITSVSSNSLCDAWVNGSIEVKIKICHRGEVNRARYMPQNPFIVATKSPSSDVYVFDITRHPSVPGDESKFSPQHICTGHSREGYGLCWNPHMSGYLLSGSDDARICLWDVREPGVEVTTLRRWGGHRDVIEDVSWHGHSPYIFGSVGDDRQLLLWDTRKPHVDEATIKVPNAHRSDINTIAFNPLHEFLLVTGSADRYIKLWDVRNTSRALHYLQEHEKEVLQVQWASFDASVLASCGADRRVRIWDLAKIGNRQSVSGGSNGPPELLFVHGGHTGQVSELSWNSITDWVLSSVSEDNVLQLWKPAIAKLL